MRPQLLDTPPATPPPQHARTWNLPWALALHFTAGSRLLTPGWRGPLFEPLSLRLPPRLPTALFPRGFGQDAPRRRSSEISNKAPERTTGPQGLRTRQSCSRPAALPVGSCPGLSVPSKSAGDPGLRVQAGAEPGDLGWLPSPDPSSRPTGFYLSQAMLGFRYYWRLYVPASPF